MNSQLAIEIAPSSFVSGGKDQQTSSGGVSGTIPGGGVAAGGPNSWSYAVGGSALAVDAYTVRVSGVAVSATASAAFEVVSSPTGVPPTTVPATPTSTVPQKTPLCGLLVFAVACAALLVIRRT